MKVLCCKYKKVSFQHKKKKMNFGSGLKKFATELSWHLRVYKPSQLNGLLSGKFSPVAALNKNDNTTLKYKTNSLLSGENVRHNLDLLQIKKNLESKGEKYWFILPKTNMIINKEIIEPQKGINVNIELPLKNGNKEVDLPCSNLRELIEPVGNVVSKKAVVLIRIRRKKMRKHKYKKFIKKMKAEFSRRKLNKKLEQESLFQKGLKAILTEGETFNAEQMVKQTLTNVHWEPPVTKVRGRLAPQWVIKDYLQHKKEEKLYKERIEECLKELK